MSVTPLLRFSTGQTVFESGPRKTEKRKKVKGGDASEIEGFLGPWAKYQDEKDVAKPSEVSSNHEFLQRNSFVF